jgi:hypothetical protein
MALPILPPSARTVASQFGQRTEKPTLTGSPAPPSTKSFTDAGFDSVSLVQLRGQRSHS